MLTPDLPEGFTFVEEPTITTTCPSCNKIVKSSIRPDGNPVFLETPYLIRTINIWLDGRVFQTIRNLFVHSHAQVAVV